MFVSLFSLYKLIWCDMKTVVAFLVICISLLTSSNLYSQGFWKQCNGPNQGSVHAIAFNSHGECFIATSPGGVYKTPDEGLNWHQTAIEYFPTYAIIVAPNQNIIAGGTANFVSTDNGYTLNPPQFINSGGSVFQFYCFGGSPSGVIYGGVQGGVFKSTDNGLTFDTTHQIFMEAVNDICVNSAGDIFVATGGAGIFRSTNGGDVWESKNTGIGTGLITNVTVNRSTGDLYAKTYSDEAKVYRSTNNGESWQKFELDNEVVTAVGYNSQGHVFASVNSKVFRSIDNGDTWQMISENTVYSYSKVIVQAPSGNMFIGGEMGIYKSTDNGTSWNIKHVYYRSFMTDIKLAPSGRLFVCSDEAGIFRSDNNRGTWIFN